MHPILVPTDFSFCANKALDYAIMLAKKAGTSLILLHVCDTIEYGFNDREILIKEYNDRKKEEAFEQLHQLKGIVVSTEKLSVQALMYEGNLSNCINKVGEDTRISMVVMGTMGATGIESRLIGSQTASVIRHCRFPVLAVPAIYDGSELNNVLFAVKDDEKIQDGLELPFDLISLFNAHLKVLLCSPDKEEAYEVMEDSRNLHYFMTRVQKSYPALSTEPEHIGGKDFYKALNSYLISHKVDLLVMVAHHHSWLQMFTGKSKTQKMVMFTEVPLLVLPARD